MEGGGGGDIKSGRKKSFALAVVCVVVLLLYYGLPLSRASVARMAATQGPVRERGELQSRKQKARDIVSAGSEVENTVWPSSRSSLIRVYVRIYAAMSRVRAVHS